MRAELGGVRTGELGSALRPEAVLTRPWACAWSATLWAVQGSLEKQEVSQEQLLPQGYLASCFLFRTSYYPGWAVKIFYLYFPPQLCFVFLVYFLFEFFFQFVNLELS